MVVDPAAAVLVVLLIMAGILWLGIMALATPTVSYSLDRRSDVQSREFERLISSSLGTTMVDGNHIVPLDDGRSFYPEMIGAIGTARHSIALECYIFHPGHTADAFISALSERARAGVTVRILLDSIGSRKMRKRHLRRLIDAGCEVAWHPRARWRRAHRLINSTHREILVVDGRVAFTGGAGISDWWGTGHNGQPPWRDTMVRVEGPVVASCLTVFAENWLECSGAILAGDDWFPPLTPCGTTAAMVIKNSSSFAGSRALFQALIECASRSIRVTTPYFVPDPSLLAALIDRARNGVEVTMLLPGGQMDHHWVRLSSRRLFRPLLDAGIRLYEYQPCMIHQKLMVIDDLWAVVGTTNLDMLSFEYLDEINVAVRDAAFAQRLVLRYEVDLAHSVEVQRSWHRSPLERGLAWICWTLAGQRWALQLRRYPYAEPRHRPRLLTRAAARGLPRP